MEMVKHRIDAAISLVDRSDTFVSFRSHGLRPAEESTDVMRVIIRMPSQCRSGILSGRVRKRCGPRFQSFCQVPLFHPFFVKGKADLQALQLCLLRPRAPHELGAGRRIRNCMARGISDALARKMTGGNEKDPLLPAMTGRFGPAGSGG